MVTTYPHIYEANRLSHPNLRLSQWGCYSRAKTPLVEKDLDFTFVGLIYGTRGDECRFLQKTAGLRPFGPGSRLIRFHLSYFRGASRLPWIYGTALNFPEILALWDRSRISYTPMGASVDPNLLQIKSRTFEMGLSRTLMLCHQNPSLERYYEPGREYVPFTDLEDCADKARFYLAHETERTRIAEKYFRRTMNEHLWEHRFEKLFSEIGVATLRSR